MRILIFTLYCLVSGLITILCHAPAFASVNGCASDSGNVPESRGPIHEIAFAKANKSVMPPSASNDYATTTEEIPITFNILANDRDSGSDNNNDGRVLAHAKIDPRTVDLNPPTSLIDHLISTNAGNFVVNDRGDLTYVPALNFTGLASIRYVVNDTRGKISNAATVYITVKNANDPPVITGQNPSPLTTNENQSIAINLNNLVVTDPDNTYPNGFTLAVYAGTNYTFSGNTITPDPNYSGTLSVPVTVNDGQSNSNTYNVQITVVAVNSAPVINGQTPSPLTTSEDQAITLQLNNLLVSDADDPYPTGFTLQVSAGTNYSVSGSTVTPSTNFSGTISVPVTVSDGKANSNIFNVQVDVSPVNDPPVITGQSPDPLNTNENQSITIEFNNVIVADPDDAYPSALFTLTTSSGANYTVSGNTVTPNPGFSGLLTVPTIVNDGKINSNSFDLKISVAHVNTAPVITGQSPLSADEDNSIIINLSHLQVTDPDNTYPDGFTLTLYSGQNYTFSGTTVTPAANYSGMLNIPVTVNDGISESAQYNLVVTINPINDAPKITGQATLTTTENHSIQLDLSQLVVSDPDNSYPAGFTLSVLAGTNYSVAGSVVTPASGFNGVLSAGVFVNDGTANSEIFPLQITVTPVNDPPVITGQKALSIAEDNSLTLQLSDLTVSDPDNSYPTGFALKVLSGTNYTVSGNIITPAINFTGILSVSVQVNDGTNDSSPFNLQISVTPINDAPVITGQNAITANEDQSLTLQLANFLVTDPDNSYPTGFTLFLFSGANYVLSGNTITPSANYSGTLKVPVQVNDGSINSNIYEAVVQVNAVNDSPIITGQLIVSTQEDTPVTIKLSDLKVIDPDNAYPNGFTVNISSGTNYTFSGSTITPALDFNGTLNVNLTVNDGVNNSATFVFQIQVGNSNDPPVITGQQAVRTNEETPVTIQLSNLIVTDPDNPYPSGFSLLISPGINFTVVGSTITPALNFAGNLTVPVRVNDGVNNSATYDIKIQVDQINDPPGFNAIPNVQVMENSGAGVVMITNVSKGPGENDQQLTFVATSGNTAIIPDPVVEYNAANASAKLKFIPAPNASGVVTITVVAIDNGSNISPNQNSYTASFQIAVAEINSAPTLDPISNVAISEDAGQQNINLTGITAGAGESQPLTVDIFSDKPELFEIFKSVYQSPGTTGSLEIKPASNAFGSAKISVKVTDNGSGISPSVNSITRTFTFTIQPVNDPPVFVSVPVLLAAVNEVYLYEIEITDVENKALPFSAPAKPSWATLTNMGNGKAKLSGTPPPSAAGSTVVKINVTDGDVTVEQQFTLVVNTRPEVGSFAIRLEEDAAFAFQQELFTKAFTDADQQAMAAIRITQKPGNGKLFLSTVEVKSNDTIPAGSLSSLVYKPDPNYDGTDVFYWKASDGYHFSAAAGSVDIDISPVNDPPVITLETDSLRFEVNGEPAFLTTLFNIADPDNDSVSRAEITFQVKNYRPEYDILLFDNSGSIKGFFDYQTGKLLMTGKAPIEEYVRSVRAIRYNHLNTLDPALELKTVTMSVNDGKVWSDTRDRFIDLKYTFIDLVIPSGFTPNGDRANDTWVISRPGGVEKLKDALIKVYNKRGVMVFKANGFENQWDGTMNGEVLPADSYFFTIDLNLKSKKTYKGIVTILR